MTFQKRTPLIILIAGRAQSGKSTVSDILKKYYEGKNYKVVVSPYTKYLKKYIEEITGEAIQENNKPRELLQKISSELIKKELGKTDFFTKRLIEDIAIYSYFMDVILVPDVRFPEEITCLKERYEKVFSIKVNRVNMQSNLTFEQQRDITETALDNYQTYDFIIDNTSIANLEREVYEIIECLDKEIGKKEND